MRRIWIEEADVCKKKAAIHTARCILKEGLEIFPAKKKLWHSWITLEQEFGSDTSLAEVLKNAMLKANNNLIFILKYSKHVWKKLDQPTLALSVLRDEFKKNPESEHLCLALQKLLRAESRF